MNLSPGEMQFYTTIISFPATIRIFFGIISDNFPINGSSRKPYIIIFGIISGILFLTVVIFDLLYSPSLLTIIMTMISVCFCWIGTVNDALIVMYSRNDMESGSQYLFSVSALPSCLGGMIGSYLGAVFTSDSNPQVLYIVMALFSFLIAFLGYWLNEDVVVDN